MSANSACINNAQRFGLRKLLFYHRIINGLSKSSGDLIYLCNFIVLIFSMALFSRFSKNQSPALGRAAFLFPEMYFFSISMYAYILGLFTLLSFSFPEVMAAAIFSFAHERSTDRRPVDHLFVLDRNCTTYKRSSVTLGKKAV